MREPYSGVPRILEKRIDIKKKRVNQVLIPCLSGQFEELKNIMVT